MCRFLWEYVFILYGKYLDVGLLCHMMCVFNFIRNCQTVCQSGCTFLHSYQQYRRVPVHDCYSFFIPDDPGSPSDINSLLYEVFPWTVLWLQVCCWWILLVFLYLKMIPSFPKSAFVGLVQNSGLIVCFFACFHILFHILLTSIIFNEKSAAIKIVFPLCNLFFSDCF